VSYVAPCHQGTVGVTRARADERLQLQPGPASSESRLQRATGSVHKWDDRATGTQGLRSGHIVPHMAVMAPAGRPGPLSSTSIAHWHGATQCGASARSGSLPNERRELGVAASETAERPLLESHCQRTPRKKRRGLRCVNAPGLTEADLAPRILLKAGSTGSTRDEHASATARTARKAGAPAFSPPTSISKLNLRSFCSGCRRFDS